MCLGSCLGSCAGSFAAGACCSIGIKSKTSKTPYIIFLVINVIIALVLNRYGGAFTIPGIFGDDIEVCTDTCQGNAAVFRVSFALAVFFALHSIFCMFFLDCHHICWAGKLIAYIGGLVGCFFISNPTFDVYARIAQIVSIFFLLAQIILLIDFAYRWNESWIEEDEGEYSSGMTVKQKALIAISILFFVISIVTWGLMFHYWNSGPTQCSRNKTLISMTIIGSVIHTVIAGSEWCEHGALLPSAVVTLYSSYLLYSSLASDPSSCNPNPAQDRSEAELWIGLVIAAFSIGYAGWNISSNSDRLFTKNAEAEQLNASSPLTTSQPKKEATDDDDLDDMESGAKKEKNVQKAEDVVDDEANQKNMSPEDAAEMKKQNAIFHFVMFAAACYMAMLLSNWGVYANTEDSLSSVDISETSLWVKIASQWATMIFYTWTLLAPKILTGREF